MAKLHLSTIYSMPQLTARSKHAWRSCDSLVCRYVYTGTPVRPLVARAAMPPASATAWVKRQNLRCWLRAARVRRVSLTCTRRAGLQKQAAEHPEIVPSDRRSGARQARSKGADGRQGGLMGAALAPADANEEAHPPRPDLKSEARAGQAPRCPATRTCSQRE